MNSTQMPVAIVTGASSGIGLGIMLGRDPDPETDVSDINGYVNRALPDAELDAFVDALAIRIASFDKQAIAETKRLVKHCEPTVRRGNCALVGRIYCLCWASRQPGEDKGIDGARFP